MLFNLCKKCRINHNLINHFNSILDMFASRFFHLVVAMVAAWNLSVQAGTTATCKEWYLYHPTNGAAYNVNIGSNTFSFNASPMQTVENVKPTSFISPAIPLQFYGYAFNDLAGVSNLFSATGVPPTLTGTPFNLGLRTISPATEKHGLGITKVGTVGDAEGEIDPQFMVQIDTLAAKKSNPLAADLLVRVASVQPGQAYAFYGSNVLGQLGTYLGFTGQTANDQQAVAVPLWRNYRYIGKFLFLT